MRWGLALGDVTQRVAERCQLVDLLIDLICFPMQHVAWKVGLSVSPEHAGNFFQRETGRLAHGDELDLQQHVRENCRRRPCRNSDSIRPISHNSEAPTA